MRDELKEKVGMGGFLLLLLVVSGGWLLFLVWAVAQVFGWIVGILFGIFALTLSLFCYCLVQGTSPKE